MTAKKIPWNTAESAASRILETTYPPVLAIAISDTVRNTCCPRGGIQDARVRNTSGPSPAK